METIIQFLNTHNAITHNDIYLWICAIILCWIFYTLHKVFDNTVRSSDFEWLDLISSGGHLSLTKTLNMIGGLIGSFIVIKMTLQSTLTPEIFLIYLAYCAGTEGFSKYLSAKYAIDKK